MAKVDWTHVRIPVALLERLRDLAARWQNARDRGCERLQAVAYPTADYRVVERLLDLYEAHQKRKAVSQRQRRARARRPKMVPGKEVYRG